MDKEIAHLARDLQKAGWRVVRSKHLRCYSPDLSVPPVTLPVTPSGKRSFANIKADLRRSGFEWDGK